MIAQLARDNFLIASLLDIYDHKEIRVKKLEQVSKIIHDEPFYELSWYILL